MLALYEMRDVRFLQDDQRCYPQLDIWYFKVKYSIRRPSDYNLGSSLACGNLCTSTKDKGNLRTV